MSQSRRQSFVEAVTNVCVGFVMAIAIQGFGYPLVGISARPGQMALVGAIFTAASLLRSYVLRRLFDRLNEGG